MKYVRQELQTSFSVLAPAKSIDMSEMGPC